MNLFTVILGTLFAVIGCFFMIVAAIGVIRLPDLYCRAHALGKAMTFGIIFLLLALGVLDNDASWLKIGIAIVFQFFTIPVASHLLCLVGYRKRLRRWSSRGFIE
jgi:multicomponent Na+:H+ antiporter subunit G